MISKTAQADVEEMWEAGLKPTFADIIRLNAVALKAERIRRPDIGLYNVRRCAFLGEGDSAIVLREPCLGHGAWMDEIESVVDLGNHETYFAVDAFICGTEICDLPPPTDREAIHTAVDSFLARLAPFTRGQVAAACLYCHVGADPLAGEMATPKASDEEDDADDPSFSFSLGVVRRGIAIGIGITLDEAMHMPRRAFDAMVEAKLRYDGAIDWKNRQGRLEDDYLRTLDEITARLKGDGNDRLSIDKDDPAQPRQTAGDDLKSAVRHRKPADGDKGEEHNHAEDEQDVL